jgi:hypothetical protein
MTGLRRRVTAICLAAAAVALPAQASAGWNVAGTGDAYAKALVMPPADDTPTVSVTGRNVTVSWTGTQLPDGTPVDAHVVRRYDGSAGLEQPIGPGCSGPISALTCTEDAVAPGNWRYTVAPRHGAWDGSESSLNGTVTVGSPTLAFTPPTTATSLPATFAGTIDNFLSGSTVTYRLDDPVSGTVLSGTTTPSPIPGNGSAAVSVTIPKGTTNGTHSVYAIGSLGDVASASIDVNVTPPTPTSLLLRNYAAVGSPRRTDRIEVTFSQRLDVASICSTWSGDSSNQSITGDYVAWVIITNNAAPSGNDLLTVQTAAAACGGQFHFGNIDLGSPNFVTGNVYYGGTGTNQSVVSWNATTSRMDITLGAIAFGPAPGTVAIPVTATYTPDSLITNPSGTPITGTASRTAVQF